MTTEGDEETEETAQALRAKHGSDAARVANLSLSTAISNRDADMIEYWWSVLKALKTA